MKHGFGFVFFFALNLLAAIAVRAEVEPAELTLKGSLIGSTFLQTLVGMENQNLAVDADLNWKHKNFRADLDLRLSTSPESVFLGNVRELSWTKQFDVATLEFGRMSPLLSLNEQGNLWRRANSRTCYTDLDCVEGGPTGVFVKTGGFTFGTILFNVPELRPNPQILADGSLNSGNRWAGNAIKNVDVDGTLLPFRFSTSIDTPLKMFFSPGLYLAYSNDVTSHFRLTTRAQYAISQDLQTERDGKIAFAPAGPGSDPTLIASANQIGRPVYEGNLGFQSILGDLGTPTTGINNSFETEISFSQGAIPLQSQAFAGYNQKSAFHLFRAGVGLDSNFGSHSNAPFAQIEGDLKISRWLQLKNLLLGYFRTSTNEAGILFSPRFIFQLTRQQHLQAGLDLISGGDTTPFFGAFRGNDQLVVSYTYGY